MDVRNKTTTIQLKFDVQFLAKLSNAGWGCYRRLMVHFSNQK